MDDVRRCRRCGEVKPLSSFHRHKGTRRAICGECRKPSSRQHNAKNNPISLLAYSIAGGFSAYYSLPKPERLKLRKTASHLLELRSDAREIYGSPDRKFSENHPEGFVYAVTNPAWPGWFKIGMTTDPPRRLNDYQTSSPFRDYSLLCWKYFEDRVEAEKRIHAHVAKYGRQEGEWFQAPKSVVISALA